MVLLQAAPSWDLVITLIFVIGVTYGFIMMRDRILVALLAIYAGTLVATTMADPIHKFFNGDIPLLNKLWVSSDASPFMIKLVIFALVIVVVATKSGLVGRRSSFSFFELGAYSFFTVCIALSSVFSFMEPAKLATFTQTSKLVTLLVDHRTLWLIAPLLILALMGSSGVSRSRQPADY